VCEGGCTVLIGWSAGRVFESHFPWIQGERSSLVSRAVGWGVGSLLGCLLAELVAYGLVLLGRAATGRFFYFYLLMLRIIIPLFIVSIPLCIPFACMSKEKNRSDAKFARFADCLSLAFVGGSHA